MLSLILSAWCPWNLLWKPDSVCSWGLFPILCMHVLLSFQTCETWLKIQVLVSICTWLSLVRQKSPRCGFCCVVVAACVQFLFPRGKGGEDATSVAQTPGDSTTKALQIGGFMWLGKLSCWMTNGTHHKTREPSDHPREHIQIKVTSCSQAARESTQGQGLKRKGK